MIGSPQGVAQHGRSALPELRRRASLARHARLQGAHHAHAHSLPPHPQSPPFSNPTFLNALSLPSCLLPYPQVRSVALDADSWAPPVVGLFTAFGNSLANDSWEGNRREAGAAPPLVPPGATADERLALIRNKYEARLFVSAPLAEMARGGDALREATATGDVGRVMALLAGGAKAGAEEDGKARSGLLFAPFAPAAASPSLRRTRVPAGLELTTSPAFSFSIRSRRWCTSPQRWATLGRPWRRRCCSTAATLPRSTRRGRRLRTLPRQPGRRRTGRC